MQCLLDTQYCHSLRCVTWGAFSDPSPPLVNQIISLSFCPFSITLQHHYQFVYPSHLLAYEETESGAMASSLVPSTPVTNVVSGTQLLNVS